MKTRLFSLFFKLSKIQTAIESERQRRKPDWMRLFRLKRLRLMLKDQLMRLSVPAPYMARQPAPVLAYAFAGNNAAHRRLNRPPVLRH